MLERPYGEEEIELNSSFLDIGALAIMTQIGESVSLVLIFSSFAVLSFLSIRSRSIKSLQFQMFLVVLVLVVAETPRVLQTLGLLVASSFTDLIGLYIHTISMVLLSAFLIYRVRVFASERSIPLPADKKRKGNSNIETSYDLREGGKRESS